MAKLRTAAVPKTYYEPWIATRSRIWEAGFGAEVPPAPDTWSDADKRQWEADWKAKRARAEKDADWIVWGAEMSHPTLCTSLLGRPVVTNGSEIITVVRHTHVLPDDGPSHEQLATRIAACVTAMAGIANPVKFMADVRAMLIDQAKSDHEDERVLTLLARCLPNDQLEEFDA